MTDTDDSDLPGSRTGGTGAAALSRPQAIPAPSRDADSAPAQVQATPERRKTIIDHVFSLIGNKPDSSLRDALEEYVGEYDSDATQSIAGHERSLISNVLALRDMRVFDVMIPRADIVAFEIGTTESELCALLTERQYSRFPVFRETLDDVIGTIHIKDILSTLLRKEPIVLEHLVRDVPIISPAMHVLDLLLEMKQTRRHMALVVDEFGGIDGLVTIGDIIEAIVGEVEDEHDLYDQPAIIRNQDGTITADGRFDVDEFETLFGHFMTDEERESIDTLGGLVFAIAGRVPSRGEVLSHDLSGMVFEVLDADPRRVKRLRIRNINAAKNQDGAAG